LRLRDGAEASLGFLAKDVVDSTGGGVTAGSTVSKPRIFFVNEVVAILEHRRFIFYANAVCI
jgi:hypothetical protein